jgi:hypothetical protein
MSELITAIDTHLFRREDLPKLKIPEAELRRREMLKLELEERWLYRG